MYSILSVFESVGHKHMQFLGRELTFSTFKGRTIEMDVLYMLCECLAPFCGEITQHTFVCHMALMNSLHVSFQPALLVGFIIT